MENCTAIALNPQTYWLLWRSPTFVTAIALRNDVVETAIASDDHTAKLWSQDGTLRRTLKGQTNEVNGVSFSPDGKIVATTSDDLA